MNPQQWQMKQDAAASRALPPAGSVPAKADGVRNAGNGAARRPAPDPAAAGASDGAKGPPPASARAAAKG